VSVAEDYAERNGIKASEIVSCSVSSDNKTVLLSASRQIPCFFCAVLGEGTAHAQTAPGPETISGSGVQASASALTVPIRAATGMVPLGVDYRTNLNFGNVVQLKQGQVGAGNWSPLALGGTGGDNYRSNIENGYSGRINAGDSLQTQPGNVVGPTNQGFQYRISMGQNQFSTGTFQNHELNDPRVMLIPVVDFSNINGSSQVPVKGFAIMWIVSSMARARSPATSSNSRSPMHCLTRPAPPALAPPHRYSNEIAQSGDEDRASLNHGPNNHVDHTAQTKRGEWLRDQRAGRANPGMGRFRACKRWALRKRNWRACCAGAD
jgi:hypothetical protein